MEAIPACGGGGTPKRLSIQDLIVGGLRGRIPRWTSLQVDGVSDVSASVARLVVTLTLLFALSWASDSGGGRNSWRR